MSLTKWLIGTFMLFAICTMFSQIIEGTYFADSHVTTLYDALMSFKAISFANPLTAIWGILVGLGQVLHAIWTAFIWDYSFLQGGYQLLRWLVLIPMSAGIAIGLMYETAMIFKIG
jgi:uncharacterized membrane protein YedE/YeeE